MLWILVDVLSLEAEEEEEAEHEEEDGGGEGEKTVSSQISWSMNTKNKQWDNNQCLVLEAILLFYCMHKPSELLFPLFFIPHKCVSCMYTLLTIPS